MQLHQVLERFSREHDAEVVFDLPDWAVKKEMLRSNGGSELLDRLEMPRACWSPRACTIAVSAGILSCPMTCAAPGGEGMIARGKDARWRYPALSNRAVLSKK
jgi:hypothetical protein